MEERGKGERCREEEEANRLNGGKGKRRMEEGKMKKKNEKKIRKV